jgi:hypothetical protein
MKAAAWLLFFAALGGRSFAQTAPAPVYVESFRKGPTRIVEATLEVKLDAETPAYEARIKDSSGEQHFLLSLTPVRVGQEDPRILSWRVSLIDLHRRLYGNLLFPYRDASLNQGPKGHAATLDPSPYAVVPLRALRVIKVESFYCSFEVKQSHLRVPEQWHVDSMQVEVRMTNTNPLGN